MSDSEKLEYATRDIESDEQLFAAYALHVMAMTEEGLHSKDDIAAELAFRDMEIQSLQQKNERLKEALANEQPKGETKFRMCIHCNQWANGAAQCCSEYNGETYIKGQPHGN